MFSRGHFTAIKFLHAQNFFEKLLAPARGIAYINNPQADMAQLVEHNLAKVGVAGSSPVVRSIACIGPVFESALFISTAKWPSGKAEACKAFTPGSNPGFASRSPKGPSERRAPFRKALACAARSAASKPTRYAGGVNRLYKTTLPPDTCDCSGRKGSETEGW